jgi:hypothetical protein
MGCALEILPFPVPPLLIRPRLILNRPLRHCPRDEGRPQCRTVRFKLRTKTAERNSAGG